MVNFIVNYWLAILVAVIMVGGVIALLRLGYKKQIKQCLLYLVTKAETQFRGKTGELKFAAVSAWIYERLPTIARIFITSKDIEKLIELGVAEMKKYLAENENINVAVETKAAV